jgi:hypothetical protein
MKQMEVETMIKAVNGEKVLAVYSFGLCGLAITGIEYGIEDKVTYYFDDLTDSPKKHRKAKIHYETERPYFKYNGCRIHLDDCMRV